MSIIQPEFIDIITKLPEIEKKVKEIDEFLKSRHLYELQISGGYNIVNFGNKIQSAFRQIQQEFNSLSKYISEKTGEITANINAIIRLLNNMLSTLSSLRKDIGNASAYLDQIACGKSPKVYGSGILKNAGEIAWYLATAGDCLSNIWQKNTVDISGIKFDVYVPRFDAFKNALNSLIMASRNVLELAKDLSNISYYTDALFAYANEILKLTMETAGLLQEVIFTIAEKIARINEIMFRTMFPDAMISRPSRPRPPIRRVPVSIRRPVFTYRPPPVKSVRVISGAYTKIKIEGATGSTRPPSSTPGITIY